MKLKHSWLLALGLISSAASANTFTYGFEGINAPDQYANLSNLPYNITSPQNIDIVGASFLGGAVLTDATYFPAHKTSANAYGTSNLNPGANLLDTLTISILPDAHVSNVSFYLFNGEVSKQDYVVSVFNGSTQLDTFTVNNLAPNINTGIGGSTGSHNSSNSTANGVGSYEFLDLNYLDKQKNAIDITNITISLLNKKSSIDSKLLPWDFLIDDVTFTGTGNFASPAPEPESYAMMMAGLAVMGFVVRRRKTA